MELRHINLKRLSAQRLMPMAKWNAWFNRAKGRDIGSGRGQRKSRPHFISMALYVFQGRPEPPPNQEYRAELMNVSPARFPNQAEGSSCPEAFSQVLQNHRCFAGTD